MPDAPTSISPAATGAERPPPHAVGTSQHTTRGESRDADGGSMKTVGVYERPRGLKKLSTPAMIVLLISVIISVIIWLRFLL